MHLFFELVENEIEQQPTQIYYQNNKLQYSFSFLEIVIQADSRWWWVLVPSTTAAAAVCIPAWCGFSLAEYYN